MGWESWIKTGVSGLLAKVWMCCTDKNWGYGRGGNRRRGEVKREEILRKLKK